MIRQENMPFQLDRPVFVKYPFQSWGRVLQKGDEFKWKEIGVTEEKALILYKQGFIYHNPEFEVELKVGDAISCVCKSIANNKFLFITRIYVIGGDDNVR